MRVAISINRTVLTRQLQICDYM